MKRHQTGYVWRVGRSWYGRYYRDELDGTDGTSCVVRRQHAEKLCDYSDRYRSKKDVLPLLEAKLRPINDGHAAPAGTLAVVAYGERFFLPYVERELKPSTANGYRALWRMYVSSALEGLVLRDARCADVTNVLAKIHHMHGVGRLTLRHCKALLSSLFTFAKRQGVIDGLNPCLDAGIPRGAEAGKPTIAYTAQEVLAMLDALDATARTAIALMYFAGLRPGEARAARWSDYDAERRTLRVSGSMWRTHLTTPKTEHSIATVPVAEVLADVLADAPRFSEFILAAPSGKPIDLHNLAARVIRPVLSKAGITWRGFYALRRGLATLATSVESPLAAKSLLRHSNVQTTAQFYIKSVPAEAVRAIEKVDALFESAANAVPN